MGFETLDIDRGFISKLLETKDFGLIKDQQIKEHFFFGDTKKVFKYLSNYYLRNGSLPTLRVFQKKFPDYELETYGNDLVGTEEPLTYWCDELRARKKHNKLAESLEEMIDHVEQFDTDTAYEVMKKTVLFIENEVIHSTAVNISENGADRKELYLKRAESDGILGIPFQIPLLDYYLKGLQKEQLITMIADTSVGKTWFQVIVGTNARLQQYRVLHLTTEMSCSLMQDRYDALTTARLLHPINYTKFKGAKLVPEEQNAYFQYLEEIAPNLEPLIIEDLIGGVSFVAAKIDQHKPDLVLIDGAYLMEDDRGAKEDWLRVAHITRDLHNLCKLRKVPIFITSQADETTTKKGGPELGNIRYSKDIGKDSDVVMSMFRDEQMREDNEMTIKILKNREGETARVMMNWNFDIMDFSAIYAEKIDGDFEFEPESEEDRSKIIKTTTKGKNIKKNVQRKVMKKSKR